MAKGLELRTARRRLDGAQKDIEHWAEQNEQTENSDVLFCKAVIATILLTLEQLDEEKKKK